MSRRHTAGKCPTEIGNPPVAHAPAEYSTKSRASSSDRIVPLQLKNPYQLQAAHGYIELGLFEEANAELEDIDPFRGHLLP